MATELLSYLLTYLLTSYLLKRDRMFFVVMSKTNNVYMVVDLIALMLG